MVKVTIFFLEVIHLWENFLYTAQLYRLNRIREFEPSDILKMYNNDLVRPALRQTVYFWMRVTD